MTTTDETYNQVLALAHKLNAHQKAHLIAVLAVELTKSPVNPLPTSMTEAWARWSVLRADIQAAFAALGPDVPTLGQQLERDRDDRQAILEGKHNVHP